MDSSNKGALDITPDVWQLIFDQHVGDYASLCNVGLTCRAWRSLSEAALFKLVDISSHNNGRVPEYEYPEVLPVVYAGYGATYRPKNLVSRQRAFLRTITARPELARYVQAFVWTLIWRDWDERNITDIDQHTWKVFDLMMNVTRLDLASLHDAPDEDYIRQNPEKLFPKVSELRLSGWMHRGLVKALLTSLDLSKLRGLDLDCLQDEGAMPDGSPMSFETALEYAHHARSAHTWETVSEELSRRQETGEAAIFPGPMWYPLRLLSSQKLDSLKRMHIKLAPFDAEVDVRNYLTVFESTAAVVLMAQGSLTDLSVVFGEHRNHYEETRSRSTCGTSRVYFKFTYRPWCIQMAATFLTKVLAVLNNHPFLQLEKVKFKGFHFLEHVHPDEAASEPLTSALRMINDSAFPNDVFTGVSCVDYRCPFIGSDCEVPDLEGHRDILQNS